MREMIAVAAFRYDGKELKVGDEFPCDERHSRALAFAGKAKFKEPREDEKVYQTRALQAEAPRTIETRTIETPRVVEPRTALARTLTKVRPRAE